MSQSCVIEDTTACKGCETSFSGIQSEDAGQKKKITPHGSSIKMSCYGTVRLLVYA